MGLREQGHCISADYTFVAVVRLRDGAGPCRAASGLSAARRLHRARYQPIAGQCGRDVRGPDKHRLRPMAEASRGVGVGVASIRREIGAGA